MKNKITPTFLIVLAIASIIGFLAIISDAFFGLDLGKYTPSILMILFGIAFLVEGQVRFWFSKFSRGGFSSTEISHIVTGVMGVIAILVGILSFLITENAVFDSLRGIISVVAIIVIIIETFFVK